MNSTLRELQVHHLLRIIREMRCFTQLYMSKEQKISEGCYSKIESGQNKLTVDRLISLVNTLEMPMIHFWFFLAEGEKFAILGVDPRELIYAVKMSLSMMNNNIKYSVEELNFIITRINEHYRGGRNRTSTKSHLKVISE